MLPFTAGEVNLVMQPGLAGSGTVTVLLDGKPVGDAVVQTSAQMEWLALIGRA